MSVSEFPLRDAARTRLRAKLPLMEECPAHLNASAVVMVTGVQIRIEVLLVLRGVFCPLLEEEGEKVMKTETGSVGRERL